MLSPSPRNSRKNQASLHSDIQNMVANPSIAAESRSDSLDSNAASSGKRRRTSPRVTGSPLLQVAISDEHLSDSKRYNASTESSLNFPGTTEKATLPISISQLFYRPPRNLRLCLVNHRNVPPSETNVLEVLLYRF